MARYRGNTRSGRPGNRFACSRYRSPRANSPFRTASSGLVSLLLIRAIIRLRVSLSTLSILWLKLSSVGRNNLVLITQNLGLRIPKASSSAKQNGFCRFQQQNGDRNAIASDVFIRKWLQLRLSALNRGRIIDRSVDARVSSQD